MLPEQPPTFREPNASEKPWSWRLLDASGGEADVDADFAGQRFLTQGDAESWVGEVWSDLADQGVTAVTLLEGEREVYGPMSLSA